MTRRIVVIGADAAGMSAANQALRAAKAHGHEIEITAFEATDHTSYSACGLPYWIAGDVDSGDRLVARTAEQHREAGIDLHMRTTVERVDLDAKQVVARNSSGTTTYPYDDLVLATGARPIVPRWAQDAGGELIRGVAPVKNLDDGALWQRYLADNPAAPVAIVGGGYIGIEMAEATLRRGHPTTLITRSRVMSSLPEELSNDLAEAMRSAGIEVIENAEIESLEVSNGRVVGVRSALGRHLASLVVIALGVTPATSLVADQIPERIGKSGGLRADSHGRVAPGLWAAGDCCEVWHRTRNDWAFLPLGTHANKHGRALGDQLGSDGASTLSFDGALGTAITRFAAPAAAGRGAYVEIAMTGLGPKDAPPGAVSLITRGSTASGYLTEAEPIAINVIADPASRRLLGVQIVGGRGAGKRIDVAASVLWSAGTIDDLAWMDLSYAPPFATAWEILQVAARRLAERT